MYDLVLYFDVLVLLIMIAMIVIGYISGATVEIIKLVKIYIPFIVVFYLGGPISRFVYSSPQFNNIISKIEFIQNMPYFNTFVMFLSTFIAFFGTYFIIGLMIKFIQKRLQSEIVNYRLGKFNHQLGSIIALVRFYVIISILILPFFLLGFTSYQDISTSVVLNYPPPYTQVGRLVHSSQPVLNASNSLTNFMEVVDVNNLKKHYTEITDLETTLNNYETQIEGACTYTVGTETYPYLVAYVNDPESCPNEELEEILPYKGLILWVNNQNIDLTNLTNDELIEDFNNSFDEIMNHTDDADMRNVLEVAHSKSEIYLVINNWLKHTLEEDYSLTDLLSDANIELIINQLIIDRNSDSSGLFYDLNQLDDPEIDGKINSIQTFLTNYNEKYEPKMATLPDNLPFKYKLIASTLQDFNFMPTLERTPLMAMYVIDSFELLAESGFEMMEGESLYHTLIKILIPLYILEPNETFTTQDMENILMKIDDAFDSVIITDDFFIELMYALTDDSEGESYLEYLISTDTSLMEEGVVSVLESYFTNKYSSDDHEKVQLINDAFSRVGGEDNG